MTGLMAKQYLGLGGETLGTTGWWERGVMGVAVE